MQTVLTAQTRPRQDELSVSVCHDYLYPKKVAGQQQTTLVHCLFLVECDCAFAVLLNVNTFGSARENRCFSLLVFAAVLWATEARATVCDLRSWLCAWAYCILPRAAALSKLRACESIRIAHSLSRRHASLADAVGRDVCGCVFEHVDIERRYACAVFLLDRSDPAHATFKFVVCRAMLCTWDCSGVVHWRYDVAAEHHYVAVYGSESGVGPIGSLWRGRCRRFRAWVAWGLLLIVYRPDRAWLNTVKPTRSDLCKCSCLPLLRRRSYDGVSRRPSKTVSAALV